MDECKLKKIPGAERWDVTDDDEWIGTVEHAGRKHWTPKDTDGNSCARFRCTSKREAVLHLRLHARSISRAKTA